MLSTWRGSNILSERRNVITKHNVVNFEKVCDVHLKDEMLKTKCDKILSMSVIFI